MLSRRRCCCGTTPAGCSGCALPTGNLIATFTPDDHWCGFWDGNIAHINPPYTPSGFGPYTLVQQASDRWAAGCLKSPTALISYGPSYSIDIEFKCVSGSLVLTVRIHQGSCASPTSTTTYNTPANFSISSITCSPYNVQWSVTPLGTECGTFPAAAQGHAPFTAVTITP